MKKSAAGAGNYFELKIYWCRGGDHRRRGCGFKTEDVFGMAITRTVDTWRFSEVLFVQPWKATTAAMASLFARVRPRREIRVPPLSREWIRQHQIDSAKHRDLL